MSLPCTGYGRLHAADTASGNKNGLLFHGLTDPVKFGLPACFGIQRAENPEGGEEPLIAFKTADAFYNLVIFARPCLVRKVGIADQSAGKAYDISFA
jgi:hypothetical protein